MGFTNLAQSFYYFMLHEDLWMMIMMLSVVPLERPHLGLSLHIEVCGSKSSARQTIRMFCLCVTVTGLPALRMAISWSPVQRTHLKQKTSHTLWPNRLDSDSIVPKLNRVIISNGPGTISRHSA